MDQSPETERSHGHSLALLLERAVTFLCLLLTLEPLAPSGSKDPASRIKDALAGLGIIGIAALMLVVPFVHG